MRADDRRQRLHDVISKVLDDEEIAVNWIVVVDVAGPSGARTLSHWEGGGIDGSEVPPPWSAMGMSHAAYNIASEKMLSMTYDAPDPEDEEDGAR